MTRRLALLLGGLLAAGTTVTSLAITSTSRSVAALTCVDAGPVSYNGDVVVQQVEACVPTP